MNHREPQLFFQFPQELSIIQLILGSSQNLSFETITAIECKHLFGQGGFYPNLASLKIQQMKMDYECINFFPKHLERLDLVNVKIVKTDSSQNQMIYAIESFLLQINKNLQTLRFLNLTHTSLGETSPMDFSVGLSCLPKLEYLILDHNSLEDHSALLFSLALTRLWDLKGLRIRNNHLTIQGAFAILTRFFSEKNAAELYLKITRSRTMRLNI